MKSAKLLCLLLVAVLLLLPFAGCQMESTTAAGNDAQQGEQNQNTDDNGHEAQQGEQNQNTFDNGNEAQQLGQNTFAIPNYAVKMSTAAVSATDGEAAPDVTVLDDEFYEYADETAPREFTVEFAGETYTGQYERSVYSSAKDYPVHTYQGESFSFDVYNGTLIMISFRYVHADDTWSEAECRAVADALAARYLAVDDYTVEVDCISDVYLFSYKRVIGDYLVHDGIYVFVNLHNGQILCFLYDDAGAFADVTSVVVDEEQIKTAIENTLTEIDSTWTDYKVKDVQLMRLPDGDCELRYNINMILPEIDDYDEIQGYMRLPNNRSVYIRIIVTPVVPNYTVKTSADVLSADRYEDEAAPREATVEFEGQTYTGAYLYTEHLRGFVYPTHRYEGDTAFFEINNGELRYWGLNHPADWGEGDMTAEQCRPTADAFAARYLSLNDYQVSVTDSKKWYTFSYTHAIEGYQVFDSLSVSVSKSGRIIFFGTINLGSFADVASVKVDPDEIKTAIENRLNETGAEWTDYRISAQPILARLPDGDCVIFYDIDMILPPRIIEHETLGTMELENKQHVKVSIVVTPIT